MKAIGNFFSNKKLKHGSLSIILTAVFIAAVIMVNIVADLVLERLDLTFDVSAGRMYSIEEETSRYLADLTDKVTITVMSREGDFVTLMSGDYYNQTNEILKRFAGANGNITLRYMDLMSSPDFAANYKGLTEGSIVIESKETGRYKVLTAEDYFHITYYDLRSGDQISAEDFMMYRSFGLEGYIYTDISAGAESAFLSAFLSVTDVDPVYVGITTGFGESVNGQMGFLLERNAYNISSIDLVTGDIPPEIDFIIIDSPSADYTLDALTKLGKWLDNNGNFGKTVMYMSHDSAETPNIDSFLSEWGIEVERAFVVQLDSRYTAPNESMGVSFQYYEPKEFNNGLNPNYNIFGGFIRHTKQVFEAKTNMTTTPILSAYEGAALYPFTQISSDTEWDYNAAERGAFPVGVMSEKIRYSEDNEAFTSNVIVFGGSNIFSEGLMSMRNANNAEYFINMMNDINGKDGVITIAPKSFGVATFDISAEQSKTIGIIFALILPLAVIILGVVIWLKRRFK